VLECGSNGVLGFNRITPVLRRRSPHALVDDPQGDIWNQIEQDYAELEDPHPGVVDDVKLLSRQLKPTAMKSMHEIAGQDEEQKPN
jgi:hypothetical protein